MTERVEKWLLGIVTLMLTIVLILLSMWAFVIFGVIPDRPSACAARQVSPGRADQFGGLSD